VVVIASFFFYGWWDWRFLSLLLISTCVDFFVGIGLSKNENPMTRKILLLVSVLMNLGLLGFFKYYDFFLDNFISAFSLFGYRLQASTLNIILPVGISFYTFQTLSYSIDVYRKQLESTKDFIAFCAFVSFFPQLVAGPIERATNLLPQFYCKRQFSYPKAVDGLRQMLWGLFKKMVIADNCAQFANMIFGNSDQYPGSALFLGAVFFAFQIYGDFSGYSDIAIGTAKLFGVDLMVNFSYPYFSRDIAEFWRRWHISLSTWFRDYVYIPLGGSKGRKVSVVRNTCVIFLLSGFWHGANWTFIAWGALNALYFLPLLLRRKNRVHIDIVAKGRFLPSFREFSSIILTFLLTCLAWVFFRALSITEALKYIGRTLSTTLFSNPNLGLKAYLVLLMVVMFVVVEWLGREQLYPIAQLFERMPRLLRWGSYYALIFIIFFFSGAQQEFIYFQF